MKPLTVLVTASGAPGTAALLRALRENGEREVRLVGTDMSERSVGRHLCDAFHLVPAGSDPGFPDAMRDDRRARGRRRGAAAVVVRPRGPRRRDRTASTAIAVLVSPPDAIHRSNDKAETLRVPAPARPAGARLPARARARPRSRRRRASSATRSGRSASSRCSRRARAASGSSTRPSTAPTSCCASGPGSVSMRLEEAVEILASVDDRTELLVMELATGAGAHDRRDRERRARSCSATRRRARRCAPGSRCTSSRSTTTALMELVERDRRRARRSSTSSTSSSSATT